MKSHSNELKKAEVEAMRAWEQEFYRFHPSILREYDIRGIVGETLHVADAYHIGRGFASYIRRDGGQLVCIGRDGRLSSSELAEALADGLTAGGCEVRDMGCGPTPMLYYATKVLQADGGIMVTGSHNPPKHNGFKLVINGKPFFGADIAALGKLAKEGGYVNGPGGRQEVSLLEAYLARLLQDYDGVNRLNVVWDAGNGAAGEVVQALAARLPGHHTVLFGEIDGTFPNHHPDPTEPKNLYMLQRAVREMGADVGLAFDGDGDRLGVVDGNGDILWGDQILVLLAEDLLKCKPGAMIIADVKASRVFFDEVRRMGGNPVMGRTGHSLIKTMMAETGAPLAGEMSGHIFFADRYYGYDDALYAAVRVLGILARMEGVSLGEWRQRLPLMVNTPEIRIPCPEDRKFRIIDEVRERLTAAGEPFNGLDGLRVDVDDGWWLLRASNTQAVLVARCEASNHDCLARLCSTLETHLVQSGISKGALSPLASDSAS